MKILSSLKTAIAVSIFSLSTVNSLHAKSADEVLVTVDDVKITAADLNQALTSSPFYTQFNTMSEDDQAALRGDLLRRLVASQLLRFEAEAQGLDKTAAFQEELDTFRTGLLYRRYMDYLRGKIKVPDAKMRELNAKFKSEPDALEAAKSAFRSSQYRRLHDLTVQSLRDRYHIKIHQSLINKDTKPDTVLLEGDQGIKLTLGDVTKKSEDPAKLLKDQVLDRLYQRGELLVIAKAAEAEKLDVSKDVAKYRRERLPALLLEKKEKEWVPNEKVLKDYFDAHPDLGVVPERWHIGQIVLKSEEEAKKVRDRIKNGESLFVLAEKLSIDPYGKSRSGDMGWVKQGTGHPAIEAVLKGLKNDEVSEIAKTPMGYHILMIIDRRPGSKQRFNGFQDKIRQMVVSEKLSDYVKTLQEKHKIDWLVVDKEKPVKAGAAGGSK